MPSPADADADAVAVRDATDADIPGILAIYNASVEATTAIWNETLVDLDDRRRWHAARVGQGYPVLVAVGCQPASPMTDTAALSAPRSGSSMSEGIAEADVLGYATFGDWRPFDGYRHTVEHSIYVAAEARGQGVASLLLAALIDRARGLDKHVMVGAIEAGNLPSIRLHRKFGFEERGRLPAVGAKFGRWLDLVFMSRVLDDRPTPPSG